MPRRWSRHWRRRNGSALNDSFPLGHMILGYVYLWQKQYEQAIAEMERAVALDPNDGWELCGSG